MKTIQTIISEKYYTYVPNEFLPVFSGGELINKREFHLYKLKCAGKRIARRVRYAVRTFKAMQAA